jgi:T5SS/PEP-CTERM-associated repeat protein
LSISAVAVLLAGTIPVANAASLAYTNTAGGSWETANNWSSHTTPTIVDTASITNNGTYTVNLNDTTADTDPGGASSWLTVNNLTVGNGTGISTLLLNFTNTAKAFTITNIVEIGGPGQVAGEHGTLVVSNGTFVVSNLFNVGSFGAAVGNLNIYGGTVFANFAGNAFRVANGSTATGMVLIAGGQLIVTNTGAFAAFIGNAGRGVLTQSNGVAQFMQLRLGASGAGNGEWNLYGGTGQVLSTSTSALQLGVAAGTTGRVLVAGGTLSTTGTVQVGSLGYGSITLSNGSLTASTVTMGASTAGSGDFNMSGGSAQIVQFNLGNGGASSRGAALITGGTLLVAGDSGGALNVGNSVGAQADMEIRGGTVATTGSGNDLRVGNGSGMTGTVLVTGGTLTVTNTSEISYIGNAGRGTLTTSNGTVILRQVIMGNSSAGSGQINLYGGTNQILTTFNIGNAANLTGNVLVAGGRMDVGGTLTLGPVGVGLMTVSGGVVMATNGVTVAGNANTAVGSLSVLGGTFTATNVAAGPNMSVGATAATTATGTVLVSDSGVIEFNRSVKLGDTLGRGYFTNQNGGTVRFVPQGALNNDPTFTVGAGSAMVFTNAIFEFKDYSAAKLNGGITNITYLGNNTISLNNSTNAMLGSYTFQTNNAPNFASLRMINGTTRWQSTNLTIGSGGMMLVSNTIGSASSIITNIGTITVANSKMTWENTVTIQGRYVSDPSTNIFLSNVVLTASGSLAGGAGDLFEFRKSLFISNTVNTAVAFDLAASTVAFTGGGFHTNAITGKDFGSTNGLGLPDGFTAYNFEYGRLTVGTTNDRIYFTSGDPSASSNALYLGWLDLAGFTNQFTSVSNMVTSLLFAPTNVNIYYEASGLQPNDAFLQDRVYQLGNGLGGNGGFLLPAVPEPSALTLFAMGTWAILLRRRKG